jgi:formylglycine-generating enzyme required for sulfatase activity
VIHVAGGGDLTVIRVESGTFTMGRKLDRAGRLLGALGQQGRVSRAGHPLRRTTITRPFYLGRTKVTVGLYCRFLNDVDQADKYVHLGPWSVVERVEGTYRATVPDDWPVATATWEGAAAFCAWLSARTGERFRLPTEAEWELAARGTEGREFPWGDEFRPGASYSRPYERVDPSVAAKPSRLSPVGSYPDNATPSGILDMFDCVGEWCSDRYAAELDGSDTRDPKGPKEGESRVLRGRGGPATFRDQADPGAALGRIYGFRVLMEAPAPNVAPQTRDGQVARLRDDPPRATGFAALGDARA